MRRGNQARVKAPNPDGVGVFQPRVGTTLGAWGNGVTPTPKGLRMSCGSLQALSDQDILQFWQT